MEDRHFRNKQKILESQANPQSARDELVKKSSERLSREGARKYRSDDTDEIVEMAQNKGRATAEENAEKEKRRDDVESNFHVFLKPLVLIFFEEFQRRLNDLEKLGLISNISINYTGIDKWNPDDHGMLISGTTSKGMEISLHYEFAEFTFHDAAQTRPATIKIGEEPVQIYNDEIMFPQADGNTYYFKRGDMGNEEKEQELTHKVAEYIKTSLDRELQKEFVTP